MMKKIISFDIYCLITKQKNFDTLNNKTKNGKSMELIYLWVEEYKNIHKQGFNFSGRYRCEYDDVKNELTIKKNEGYAHIVTGKQIGRAHV